MGFWNLVSRVSSPLLAAVVAVTLTACDGERTDGSPQRSGHFSSVGRRTQPSTGDHRTLDRQTTSLGPRGVFEPEDFTRFRVEQARAESLRQTLASWPGVSDASVHLALADHTGTDWTPPPRQHPRASVWLLYEARATLPTEMSVKAFISGAVQGLDEADVRVVIARAQATDGATRWAKVMGVTVKRESVRRAKVIFGLPWAVLIVIVLAGGALRQWRNRQG